MARHRLRLFPVLVAHGNDSRLAAAGLGIRGAEMKAPFKTPVTVTARVNNDAIKGQGVSILDGDDYIIAHIWNDTETDVNATVNFIATAINEFAKGEPTT
jgi:hypothetical protein